MLFQKNILVLIIFAASIYSPLNSYAFTTWNVLNKNGYKMHYTNTAKEYALNLSADIENNFVRIKNFIGYKPDSCFDIYLVQKGYKWNIVNFFKVSGNGIKVYIDEDYNKSVNRIWEYSVDKTISMLYDKSSGLSVQKIRGYESWLSQTLAHYIIEGFSSEDDMILRSLIARHITLPLSSDATQQFSKTEIKALHLGLVYFITESYGNNLMISILNNISYCGGFIKSLEFISGHNLETVEKDFNNFFESRYFEVLKNNDSINKTKISDLNNSNILAVNQKGEILAYNNLTHNIDFLLSDSGSESMKLNIMASIPFKAHRKNIIQGSFYNGNRVVITVTGECGTHFYFYNILNLSLQQKIFIPYVFLRELSGSHFHDGIVFSGSEGKRNGIFILNTESMEIEKVTKGKGFYCFPAVLNNEKIIFVEKTDKRSVFKIDRKGENMTLLWEPRNTVKDLAVSEKGDLYFSWNLDGIYNIYRFNISEKKITQLTNYNTGAFNPLIYKNKKIIIKLYSERKYQKAVISDDI
ncbi:MAG: hypothetical protein WDA74_04505 [Spirochaetota bacterium]